jgi:hypothetical protein
MLGLAHERLAAAERPGIQHLQEHVRGPALGAIRATAAGEPAGERLDQQPQRKALVAVVQSPHGQQGAGGCASTRARVVGRFARASTAHRPGNLRPSAARRLVSPLVVIDVEMSSITGSPAVGQAAAIGSGVITCARPPCGATPVATGSEVVRITMSPWSATGFR